MERSDLGLTFKDNKLQFYNCELQRVASEFQTPFYLYSEVALNKNIHAFNEAKKLINHETLVCFALKSNPNRRLIKHLANKGFGADVVSQGELLRAIDSGIPSNKIVFSGVGKQFSEIELAIRKDILSINVESLDELQTINEIAKGLDKVARVAFRLNPNVNALTHKHISTGSKRHKFGMQRREILKALEQKELWTNCKLIGLSVHIGSQLKELDATKLAIKATSNLAEEIGIELDFIDVGGGLGVSYQGEEVAGVVDYMKAVSESLSLKNVKRVIFEPGRVIAASAGVFVTKVIRVKSCTMSNFIIVDGGMNDFIRPSLYGAKHMAFPSRNTKGLKECSIVGPICETADTFAEELIFSELEKGDLIALAHAGAYGRSMSSNYNLRELPKEIWCNKEGELSDISP